MWPDGSQLEKAEVSIQTLFNKPQLRKCRDYTTMPGFIKPVVSFLVVHDYRGIYISGL